MNYSRYTIALTKQEEQALRMMAKQQDRRVKPQLVHLVRQALMPAMTQTQIENEESYTEIVYQH